MPTYVCTVREGQLSPDQKSRIAAEVTRIHSEVTGAPTFFAQVIFEEVKPGNHFMGGVPLVHDQLYDQVFVYGRVRAGRSIQEKLKMIKRNCPGRVVGGSSWTADSDQDLGVLEERLDDVPMVLLGG